MNGESRDDDNGQLPLKEEGQEWNEQTHNHS